MLWVTTARTGVNKTYAQACSHSVRKCSETLQMTLRRHVPVTYGNNFVHAACGELVCKRLVSISIIIRIFILGTRTLPACNSCHVGSASRQHSFCRRSWGCCPISPCGALLSCAFHSVQMVPMRISEVWSPIAAEASPACEAMRHNWTVLRSSTARWSYEKSGPSLRAQRA